MTYVTCPTLRYHPAVVAQKAATMQLLSEGRFTLGLGSGENLNEHVVGEGWPMVGDRQDMLEEAIHIIRELHTGELRHLAGRLLPGRLGADLGLPRRRGAARRWRSRGRSRIERFGAAGRPRDRGRARGRARARLPRLPAGRRRQAARDRADPDQLGPGRGQGRGAGATSSSAGSPGAGRSTPTCRPPRASPAPRQLITPDQVAESIPCGPDLDAIVEAARAYWEAGFTDIALVQVGDEGQQRVPRRGRRTAAREAAGRRTLTGGHRVG